MQVVFLFFLGLVLVSAGCTRAAARPLEAGRSTPTVPQPPADPPQPGNLPAKHAPETGRWTYLTGGRTWQRPLADPRWPTFSASYRFQDNGRHLDSYEHLSAGDTVALARGPLDVGGRVLEVELAIQAGVFSVFDPSFEQSLIIIDYTAGVYAAARSGRTSGILRVWHLSGHVGDEFLLEDRYEIDVRTPYKFEAVQVMGSYDLPCGFRAYGGPSVLFGVNPSDLGSLILHGGVEWRAHERLLGLARPVAGAEVQMLEGLDFNPDLSLRLGLSFDGGTRGPAFAVLGELYSGRDPNGELFSDRVSYAGVGIFLNL
jgi:hypothetical protein